MSDNELADTILGTMAHDAERRAAESADVLRFIQQERDEWKARALAAEEHLAAIHARFFDLLERPAGL